MHVKYRIDHTVNVKYVIIMVMDYFLSDLYTKKSFLAYTILFLKEIRVKEILTRWPTFCHR